MVEGKILEARIGACIGNFICRELIQRLEDRKWNVKKDWEQVREN